MQHSGTPKHLRFQLKFGPSSIPAEALKRCWDWHDATVFYMHVRKQDTSMENLEHTEAYKQASDGLKEQVKLESTLLLEQPVVTTFAINLRHLQNYRNGASLFQRGVTISQPSKDISASWKEVIDQLQAIRKDWDFDKSSQLINKYQRLIKEGELVDWENAFFGMKVKHVCSYFHETGCKGVVVRRLPRSHSTNTSPHATLSDFGVPHFDSYPKWLHGNALKRLNQENSGPFHMFITFNIWVPLGPVKNQTLAVRDWEPWGRSAMSTPRNFLCHDVAFDMRKPDGYSGLSDPKPDEFIVMLQHTSLRPAYEGVSHFGATVVDQHNTEHVRESCEVRMVASFTIPGESEIIPETSEWQRYRYAGGQIFYANDYQQKTAWMPPDQRLFRSVNKEVFQRVYHQLNHSKRAPPIPWLKLKEHLSDQRVYKLKSY